MIYFCVISASTIFCRQMHLMQHASVRNVFWSFLSFLVWYFRFLSDIHFLSSSLDSFLLVRFIYTCTALPWYLFFSQLQGGGGLLCKVSAAVQNYTIHALIIKYIDFASNIYTDYQIIKFLNPRLVFIRSRLNLEIRVLYIRTHQFFMLQLTCIQSVK